MSRNIKNVIYRFSFELIFAIEKKIEILRNLFLRLEEFGNICGTNFCDLGPKSQKFVPKTLIPQHFMPAKFNALKVAVYYLKKQRYILS